MKQGKKVFREYRKREAKSLIYVPSAEGTLCFLRTGIGSGFLGTASNTGFLRTATGFFGAATGFLGKATGFG